MPNVSMVSRENMLLIIVWIVEKIRFDFKNGMEFSQLAPNCTTKRKDFSATERFQFGRRLRNTNVKGIVRRNEFHIILCNIFIMVQLKGKLGYQLITIFFEVL